MPARRRDLAARRASKAILSLQIEEAMQVSASSREAVSAQIERAFENVSIPARIEEMLFPRYTGDDAHEMAAAFVGRPWSEIPIHELFFHREMLGTFAPEAYRAYLPAYLQACIASDDPYDKYTADIITYTFYTLKCLPSHSEDRRRETEARLSLLNVEQRAAVAAVLRYLESRWGLAVASEILSG